MSRLASQPILTETFESVLSFVPPKGSAYLFADNGETRSRHIQSWLGAAEGVEFVEITRQGGGSFDSGDRTYALRRSVDVESFVRSISSPIVYVDITGLRHAVWAPLIKALFFAGKELRATYVEPDAYRRSVAPLEGQIYDLSTSIEGIAPLPGFTVLTSRGSSDDDFLFLPLLGFEGVRFKYLIEQVQPKNDSVIPIIGVPGFKTWYVFETYFGNAPALRETSSWRQARYAPANCPFSCFYLLRDIAGEYPQKTLKVAPIGTKPHALGAILFALAAPTPIEIVYDNPIRKAGRTQGVDRLFVYYISSVLGSPVPA
jgi:hypothetical protein